MDERRIAELIDAATKLVSDHGDAVNRTVAAAATTERGKIFTSLNLYHFTGGPCAELALLARLASEGERPVALVAVGDRGRNVLPPGGRCRQVMVDYFPEMQIVVSQNGSHIVCSIKDLLPYTYIWNDQQGDGSD